MRSALLASLAVFVLMLAATGCSSLSPTATTSVRVRGTPGAEFTVSYSARSLSGAISTQLQSTPATVLEISGRNFSCELAKKDSAADLVVEILEGGATVFEAKAPAGTQGVRVSPTPAGWKQETYP